MSAPIAVSTLEGYERWAGSYPQVPGNPLMRAEQELMLAHCPEVDGRRVLDLACGSGRYAQLLAQRGAEVVALDLSGSMLRRVASTARVRARMSQLPFAAAAFDAVVCGLAIGHLPELAGFMNEVARVLKPAGTLLYSDFHPAAAAAGHTRTFKDEHHQTYILPHAVHELESQRTAAAAAGFRVLGMYQARAGIELTDRFPGCEDFYRRWHGLPLVLVVGAQRS